MNVNGSDHKMVAAFKNVHHSVVAQYFTPFRSFSLFNVDNRDEGENAGESRAKRVHCQWIKTKSEKQEQPEAGAGAEVAKATGDRVAVTALKQ